LGLQRGLVSQGMLRLQTLGAPNSSRPRQSALHARLHARLPAPSCSAAVYLNMHPKLPLPGMHTSATRATLHPSCSRARPARRHAKTPHSAVSALLPAAIHTQIRRECICRTQHGCVCRLFWCGACAGEGKLRLAGRERFCPAGCSAHGSCNPPHPPNNQHATAESNLCWFALIRSSRAPAAAASAGRPLAGPRREVAGRSMQPRMCSLRLWSH
jgi:hypothetical protein